MKKCIKCGIEKDEDNFYKQGNKNLRIGTCIECHKIIMIKWQKENPEKCKKAWTKFNRQRNKGRICEWCKQIYKIASSQKGCSLKCRFELGIEKKETGCWHWIKGKGGRKNQEYGHIFLNGKPQIASRFSYELHKGKIPEGKFVLHTCDNSICVNPDHLYIGDHQQNMNDMNSRGRGNAGRLHIRKYGLEKMKKVFEMRDAGALYNDISLELDIPLSSCKFIYKHPERLNLKD